jgi:Fe-Mn family superoxide dismutase
LKISPNDQLSILAAVFNGDPAGPGPGDPQRRDPTGTSFRVNDPPLFIGEIDFAYNQDKTAVGLPGTVKLGGWYHFGRFADQRFSVEGLSLADPRSSGMPAQDRGNFGIYAIVDQMLWRVPGTTDQGLGIFARASVSPSDRNLISAYFDGGATYKGLFPGRENDTLGVGFGLAKISSRAQALDRDFGSVTAWRAEFTAMAKALAGGSGWVILAWSERLGRLVNEWAADHAHGLPGATPILALDMYEHAYHLDFGARAAAYVDQVMANLNWERIGARYRLAIGEGAGEDEFFLPYGAPAQQEARISAEELKAALEGDDDRRPVLLDLCLPVDLPRRTDMLAGASMHAPAALARWVEELPRGRPIAVYCICGFQVSGTAVTELRRQGYNARALVGGITAWHAIGGTTVPLDTSTYEGQT